MNHLQLASRYYHVFSVHLASKNCCNFKISRNYISCHGPFLQTTRLEILQIFIPTCLQLNKKNFPNLSITYIFFCANFHGLYKLQLLSYQNDTNLYYLSTTIRTIINRLSRISNITWNWSSIATSA